MRLTPEEIEARRFRLAPNGYECEAVDRFLAEITESLRNEPEVGPENDEFSRVGQEIAALLRAARSSAGAVRAEADGFAASIRSRAELEATDIRREAEQQLEQARQVLATAEAQARVVVEQAEVQTAAAVAEGRAEGEARARAIVEAAEAHAEEVRRAQRAAEQRLLAARTDLQVAIDRLAGADPNPLLDLTETTAMTETPERAQPPSAASHAEDAGTALVSPEVGGTTSGLQRVPASPADARPDDPDASGAEGVDDPLLRMVRAAVGRAAGHSTP